MPFGDCTKNEEKLAPQDIADILYPSERSWEACFEFDSSIHSIDRHQSAWLGTGSIAIASENEIFSLNW